MRPPAVSGPSQLTLRRTEVLTAWQIPQSEDLLGAAPSDRTFSNAIRERGPGPLSSVSITSTPISDMSL